MTEAEISRGGIQVDSTDPKTLASFARILGARRSGNGILIPLSESTLNICIARKAHIGTALKAYGEGVQRVRRYTEYCKTADHVEPIKPIPIKQPYTMYQHQVRAYNIGLTLRDSALFLEMGLGKSLSAIMVAGRRYLDGKIKRVLVIAPTSVCPVWPSEFEKFGDFRTDCRLVLGTKEQRVKILTQMENARGEALRVAVINYESTWRLEDELRDFNADMIICDESQRIKNHSAKQSKAIHKLGDRARYRMILTGTPIQKDTRDIWSQYRFLDPTVFPFNYYSFERRYATMGGFGGHQYLSPRNLTELTERTHSIAYRATKAECLDLPEKTFETRPVLLDDKAAALYKQIAKQSFAELEGMAEVTANHVLTRMLRLQQLTGGFLKDDVGVVHQVNHAKLDALEEIVRTLVLDEDKKLVIFARFLNEMDGIQGMLTNVLWPEGYSFVRIDGSVKTATRGEYVQTFQTDDHCRVFLGEIDACAEGLTLTAASTCVYYSLNFNYARYSQSLDRIHRIGQTGTCSYLHLVCPKTIDTKIMDALEAKEELAASVVDHWRDLIFDE